MISDWIMQDDSPYVHFIQWDKVLSVKKVRYDPWDIAFVIADRDRYDLKADGTAKNRNYSGLDGKWKLKSGSEVKFVNVK